MNMQYRLVALDVDGTLLNDDHELTAPVKEAVQLASQAGATIVLCTGRSPSNTLYLMEELGLKGVVITHNGAVTLRSEDRSVLHSFAFGMKDVDSLLIYSRNRGIHYDANSVFDIYIDQITPAEKTMYDKFGIVPSNVPDVRQLEGPIYKFTISGSAEDMERTLAVWEEIGCPLVPFRSGERFIDVMHPEATKGNALRQLARILEVPREQVMAIGNYFNDLAMLEFAGLGIAMDNSPDGVKAAADEVTLSNNDNGVRAALFKHVLQTEA